MNTKLNTICVIGLGYIGSTLAAVLAESGFKIIGVEKDKDKLEQLKKGKPNFYEKGFAELLSLQVNKNLLLFNEVPPDKKIDAFIIAVATPVDPATKVPNMEYVKGAVDAILPYLKEGQLVVLRSTVPVGTTRNVVLPMIRQKHQNISLSFCPERIIEGKALIELETLPQIIGALDEKSMALSEELFSKMSPSIVKTSSLEAAETIKLINNSYRDFTFAYANQIALICKKLGLDAMEIINAANFDYPRSNIPQPGFVGSSKPGFVGGVCLEKDPYILINSSGLDCSLIKAARAINEGVITNVFERIAAHLKEKNILFSEAKIFISGLAFKGRPETDDLRGSPALQLLDILKKSQAKNIFGHDFVVKEEEIKKLNLTPCSPERGFENADVAVFMNNHKGYEGLDIKGLAGTMKKGAFLFDGWQMFREPLKDIDAINYESIGFKKPSR